MTHKFSRKNYSNDSNFKIILVVAKGTQTTNTRIVIVLQGIDW